MTDSSKLYIPVAEELRDYILTDIRLEARKDGAEEPAVQPGTDLYRWATGHAQMMMLGFANIDINAQQITPVDADEVGLEDWRIALGLPIVQPSPSSGRVVVRVAQGTATFVDGAGLVLPNGLRLQVSGTQANKGDLSEIDVIAVDTGSATNAPPDTVVRFVAPPYNVQTEARVSLVAPLSGGFDAETVARKRERILNALRYRPGGGNWAHLREIALNASAAVNGAWVYPALGGPASVKLVVAKGFDFANRSFARADAALATAVASRVYAELPDSVETVIQTVDDIDADVSLRLKLPVSSALGGSGGWVDAAPWPPLHGGQTRVTVVAVYGAGATIELDAATPTAPVAGQTEIAVWVSGERRFHRSIVDSVGGGVSAWVLGLRDPLPAAGAVGDYVSPAAESTDGYGETWMKLGEALGAGENTADPLRLPRALRHPYVRDEGSATLGAVVLSQFLAAHDEISDASYAYRSATEPPVPAGVDDPPGVLVPRHFGVYPL